MNDYELRLPWGDPLLRLAGGVNDQGEPLPPLELFQCPRCCALVQAKSRAHHEGWHVLSVKETMP